VFLSDRDMPQFAPLSKSHQALTIQTEDWRSFASRDDSVPRNVIVDEAAQVDPRYCIER
jgi:hypothetical protein